MIVTRPWALPFVLLAATAGFGVLAVTATPEGGTAIGLWPVAGPTVCLMVTRRPRTWVVVALTLAIAVLSLRVGRELDVAIGIGIGLTLDAWLMWRIFAGGERARPALQSDRDLARFVGAATAGALASGAVTFVTSVVTGWSSPPRLALAVIAVGLASHLTVVPFFARLQMHRSAAGTGERVAQWALAVLLTPLVFFPTDFPALVFLVIPVLAWGAMRYGAYEALAQMVVVVFFAINFTTYGYGPFARVDSTWGLHPDAQGIILDAFAVDCALVVLPLLLTVGNQVESARIAAAERDKVQNIVSGTTGVAIIGTDGEGKVTLFNPGAERLLGYRAQEMLGQRTRQLHSDDAIAAKAAELGVANDFSAVARALMGRGPTEMRFRRKDGVERLHSMYLNRITDDRGLVLGYVSTSEDVTERIEAELRLRESLDTEREAVERLREVDQVKDAFVSSVSHELRTPITSILGYVEMLEDGAYGGLGPDQLDAVRRVAANSSRLLSLIDDLLTLSRVHEEGIGYVDRLVDLRKIVSAGVEVVVPNATRRTVELSNDLPDEPIPFLGDRDMLERVVINLVGNAVKFTPEGGRVQVRLEVEDGFSVLEVVDTGIGIPHAEQERLFSRFFRSSLAQAQAIPGSGLGLSIAHAIVEQHGGRMSVESEPGEGTTFRVHLPVLAPS